MHWVYAYSPLILGIEGIHIFWIICRLSVDYTRGDFMFLYRFVCGRRPQNLVHTITSEWLFTFLSFLALAMTLTLNFQGQVWNFPNISQKWFDCHKMKSTHIDWTEGLKDHQVWPWPWPWKVKCQDLTDSDRGDFRCRYAFDSSHFISSIFSFYLYSDIFLNDNVYSLLFISIRYKGTMLCVFYYHRCYLSIVAPFTNMVQL